MRFSTVSCHLLVAVGLASAAWIVPGARWRDTDGNLVNAHAGCVTVDEKSGKFFLFGEYKVQGQVEGGGIAVYSSDDLATWKSHGMALSMAYSPIRINTLTCLQSQSAATRTSTPR